MPQGILIGVPAGGRTSGRGSTGNGVTMIRTSVFSSVEVPFSGAIVVGGTDNLVEGLGLGSRRGVRNSHPSR